MNAAAHFCNGLTGSVLVSSLYNSMTWQLTEYNQ